MAQSPLYRGKIRPTLSRKQYDEKYDTFPGPGTYETKSTISINENVSTRRCEPHFSFSKASRSVIDKQYLSAEMQLHIPNTISKNCDYHIGPNTLGTGRASFLASCRTSPRYRFPRSNRDEIDKQYVSKGITDRVPPKTTLNVSFINGVSSMGKTIDSTKETQPSFEFSKSDRDVYEKTYMSPEHQARIPNFLTKNADFIDKSAFGLMSESIRSNTSNYIFETQPRDSDEKIYVDFKKRTIQV